MSVEFCDSNVLVYAYDASAGDKRRAALALMDRLWDSGEGAISIQVLQELYVTLVRKIANPLSAQQARGIVEDLTAWRVFQPSPSDVVDAIDASERWMNSFWDAMIITAAQCTGATVLWSEDLNDGQDYEGTIVRNPFR